MVSSSPILVPIAVIPKWLPQHPRGATAAVGGSFGEGHVHLLLPDKGAGLEMDLLKSAPAILPAQA